MPVVGWIDALRQYNAGMPSWCVPRKGTPGYDMVMRIRQGEKPKTFKELTAELERKTGGKPKEEKTSMRINLGESKDVVSVPTIPTEAPKTERKESTQKLSHHKTMAVIPVNYVAEGGSAKKSYDVRDAYRRMKEAHKYYEDAKLQSLVDEMAMEQPKVTRRMEALERKSKEAGGLTDEEERLMRVLKDDLLIFKRALKEMKTAIEADANMKRFRPEEYEARRTEALKKLEKKDAKKKEEKPAEGGSAKKSKKELQEMINELFVKAETQHDRFARKAQREIAAIERVATKEKRELTKDEALRIKELNKTRDYHLAEGLKVREEIKSIKKELGDKKKT